MEQLLENSLYYTWYNPKKVNQFLRSANFFLFYFIFKFYIIVLVLPNIKMSPPQVYMCSPSWTLLAPPSPYHPSGSSQCTSPKHPVSMHDSLPFDKWSLWVCPVNMRRMAHVPPSPPLIVSAGRKASQSSQTLASHFFHDTVGKNQIPWGPPLGIDNPSI